MNGYHFAERKGVDSIAVIGFRGVPSGNVQSGNVQVLLHEEINPAQIQYRKSNVGAIGGTLDPELTPRETAAKELEEEAGYTVDPDELIDLGIMFCTTQSNEHVHLFAADLTGVTQHELNLEPSEIGFALGNTWHPYSDDLLHSIVDPRFVVGMARLITKAGID